MTEQVPQVRVGDRERRDVDGGREVVVDADGGFGSVEVLRRSEAQDDD